MDAPFITYAVECRGPDGELKWTEEFRNLVPTAGKNDVLTKYLKGSSYTAAWYLGLKGSGTPAAADTLASHSSWSEVNPYTGNRPAITWGTSSSGSNTGTGVAFTVTAAGPVTVAGAFIASVNSGTSGILYSVGDFSVARVVALADVLTVVPTASFT